MIKEISNVVELELDITTMRYNEFCDKAIF
jgi:hypothetical protein